MYQRLTCIFLTAVESRACAMWCSEVTDSGLSQVYAKFSTGFSPVLGSC
ncbi:MAG: hypothetical protein OFPII_17950 [Osedax symbiont Rs1]|nr:MAG: hypothetical protein OFPII_17950 [Osedax symbiont Rs1]